MNNKTIFDLNIKNILANWQVSDAIRELIANAIDESKLTNSKFPLIQFDGNSELIIIDYGRGINSNHFIQNENKEKIDSKNVIGKFGIGLKDAVSVLFRNHKPILFKSKFGSFKPVEEYKNGIKEKIKTLHIEFDDSEKIENGTYIVLNNITWKDYEEAISNFLDLSSYEKLSYSDKGEVYSSKVNSEIFLNGMKISTDDNFLFSYNILEPNAKLSRSINRERKMISRDAYRDNVISILKTNINNNTQNLINDLIDTRDKFANGEWSLIDVKKLALKHTNRKILVGCQEINSTAYKFYATEKGYEIIWINSTDYKNIEKDKNYTKFTLDEFGKNFLNNYESTELSNDDLVVEDKSNWDWAMNLVRELSKIWPSWNKKINNYKFNVIKDHPEALGIHSENKIEIIEKILNNKEQLFNTLIHEICHAISGADDATIEFESILTAAYYYILKLGEY